jgi:hypothetical protein
VVGCGVNMDDELIEFWLNGEHMGIAFKSIFAKKQFEITKLVYPALSFSISEGTVNTNVRMILDAKEMRYGVVLIARLLYRLFWFLFNFRYIPKDYLPVSDCIRDISKIVVRSMVHSEYAPKKMADLGYALCLFK